MKKPKISLRKIKEAAHYRKTKGHFCCDALIKRVSPEARAVFNELFCPDFAYGSSLSGWSFRLANQSYRVTDYDANSIRDLAMCLFYEIVKHGDY